MIKTVSLQQEEVWKDFASQAWPEHWPDGSDGQFKLDLTSQTTFETPKEIWNKIRRPQSQFTKFKRRVAKLDEDAQRVERAIDRKLDLKTKHANMNESHVTAIISAAVFGFTIITIIFTPLSFIVSLFTLPIDRFQKQQVPSLWNNQTGMYSTNYIGKWIATAELVSVSLTLVVMWFMVEYGLHVPITHYTKTWAKGLRQKAAAKLKKSNNGEQPEDKGELPRNQSKPERRSKKQPARHRKWFKKSGTDGNDEERGMENEE